MHSHLARMLGTYIVESRVEKNLNQGQLAQKLSITPQFLGRIEKGDVMIPDASLIKCIQVLKLKKKKILEIYRASSEYKATQVYLQATKDAAKNKMCG